MNQSIMMDFEIVTFWGKFWVRKGIMKWISIILFWTTVMIFGTWLWEYGLILVAPVDFEIITWFGFAWMPDPAGGQDGHLNHACVLWLFCSDRLDFQKDIPDDFFISMLSTHLSTLQEWSSWITFITIPRLTKTTQTIKFQCVFVPPCPPWASI